MTDLVSQLVGALEAFPEDPNPYTYRIAHAKARAALTAAKAGGWQGMESAPKDGTRILVWRKHATRPLIARYQKDFEWFEDEDGVHLYHLIYWQPLPNPPKEQSAGGLGSVDAVANPLSPT